MIEAGLPRLAPIFLLAPPGDGNEQNMCPICARPDTLGNFIPVQVRHAGVEYRDIRRMRFEQMQGHIAVIRHDDMVTFES